MEDVNLFRMSAQNVEFEQLFDRNTKEYYTMIRYYPVDDYHCTEPPEDRIHKDRRIY